MEEALARLLFPLVQQLSQGQQLRPQVIFPLLEFLPPGILSLVLFPVLQTLRHCRFLAPLFLQTAPLFQQVSQLLQVQLFFQPQVQVLPEAPRQRELPGGTIPEPLH